MLTTEQLMEAANKNIESDIRQLRTEIGELGEYINKHTLAEDTKTIMEVMTKGKIKDRLEKELQVLIDERAELKTRAERFWNQENSANYASQRLAILEPLETALLQAQEISGAPALLAQVRNQVREHKAQISMFDALCLNEPLMFKAI